MVDVNRFVALLRGINVGSAKRIPMATLRECLEESGLENVRTHLQSGNVVFDSPEIPSAAGLEASVLAATSVQSSVVVLAADDFREVVRANPFRDATDKSRMLIHFIDRMPAGSDVRMPDPADLAPEQLEAGARALYQWAPDGILASKIPPAFYRQFPGVLTARNLRTVERILTMVDDSSHP
jgi:uncharacterized protein (DUF1697 family)